MGIKKLVFAVDLQHHVQSYKDSWLVVADGAVLKILNDKAPMGLGHTGGHALDKLVAEQMRRNG